MSVHEIALEHKAILAKMQHTLEWLQGENMRLQTELGYVITQGQRLEQQLSLTLLQHYGIAPQQNWTLDVEAGTITLPDEEPAPEAAPEPESNTPSSEQHHDEQEEAAPDKHDGRARHGDAARLLRGEVGGDAARD